MIGTATTYLTILIQFDTIVRLAESDIMADGNTAKV